MKLRLRSSDSKQTLKLEVPNPCTLLHLKHILSLNLPNSPSPASIRLSLNRKDSLQSDGQETLLSLGITAGDLIFFSAEQSGTNPIPQNPIPSVTVSAPEPAVNISSERSSSSDTLNTLLREPRSPVSAVSGFEKGEALDGMEVDEGSYDVDKSFSVPGFLRKVFTEELDGDGDAGRDHKLIAVAVHAVILESGFVGFDRKANGVVNGFPLRDMWELGLFRVPLSYTLPGCLKRADDESVVKSVVLKIQSLGKFVNVYGTLDNGLGKRGTYRVQLNEERLVPFLNVVWANCGVTENISGHDGGVLGTSPEKEVFSFWRTVKDSLALPLLIDLCEEAGLELPPCFMRLPTDLKLKILEFLPGVDVAKVSCACSELRYLGSSDDLWKVKYAEEFGNEKKGAQGSWKKEFSTSWKIKKSRKLAGRGRATPYWAPYWDQSGRRRYPNPFMVPRVPRMIGGDYDISPSGLQTGIPHDSVNFPGRNFSPRCNLGVRGGRFV